MTSKVINVILTKDIRKLGNSGALKPVKRGYALNHLIPSGSAVRATEQSIKEMEIRKAELEKANEAMRKEALLLKSRVEKIKFSLIRKTSDGYKLYGAITNRDIEEILKKNSINEIRKEDIVVKNAKSIGDFPVTIYIYGEIQATVTLNVFPEEENS
ncbi:50S ribosomal protein L9 [Candidatus Nesciobacter abundans]|uniref:Large ribosomal subunit protein bL9 n=1 Tax=Candidatus Nesciobacter abundans TaxID=2601668 RepID=A0A5C0UH43_9PROT|nr:50S ribosomal protein L9 [Candidatus Nesciobacter abundans]QEK38873.1 50S ribosomal protein L9 [Candidatus Nesciobacter abundans]